MNKAEFKKLQNEWYQKLAESGFRDIESDGEPKYEFDTLKYYPAEKRRITEHYFELIRSRIENENTTWKREIDRRVLTLYSEGNRIWQICHALRMSGDSRSRSAVRFIIRRYEYAWKIKSYSRTQRHLRSLS